MDAALADLRRQMAELEARLTALQARVCKGGEGGETGRASPHSGRARARLCGCVPASMCVCACI